MKPVNELKIGDRITIIQARTERHNNLLSFNVSLERAKVEVRDNKTGAVRITSLNDHGWIPQDFEYIDAMDSSTFEDKSKSSFTYYLFDPCPDKERQAWIKVFDRANRFCNLFNHTIGIATTLDVIRDGTPASHVAVDVTDLLFRDGKIEDFVAHVIQELRNEDFCSMAERYEEAMQDIDGVLPALVLTSAYVTIDVDAVELEVAAEKETLKDEMLAKLAWQAEAKARQVEELADKISASELLAEMKAMEFK